MKEKGLERRILERIKGLYEEITISVRIKGEETTEFRTTLEVRQGCVLSPLLFNLYVADLNKHSAKRDIGGVKLGKIRIWGLAYADDIVLIAKNRVALLDMMQTLKGFLKERQLILNTEKSKVMIFNKDRRRKNEKWK